MWRILHLRDGWKNEKLIDEKFPSNNIVMCKNMKKLYLFIVIIVSIPIAANLYILTRLGPHYIKLEAQDVAVSYRNFAAKIENGELTNMEVSSRLLRMAEGEDKITSGLKKIRNASYSWLLIIFFIGILQAMLIFNLVKTHNNTIKNRP